MKIAVVGGGPGGLYFASLVKQFEPTSRSGSATHHLILLGSALFSVTRRSPVSESQTRPSTRRCPRPSPTGMTSIFTTVMKS